MRTFVGHCRGKHFITPIVLWSLLLASCAGPVWSADLPGLALPGLDNASTVVIGRITSIADVADQRNYWYAGNIADWGTATVEVKEVLKGPQLQTVKFAVMAKTNQYTAVAQTFAHIHSVGDSGIWVADSNSVIAADFGFLNEGNRENVEQALHILDTRQWSVPVNGLQAWAVVVSPSRQFYPNESYPGDLTNSVIMFALRNASQSNIFVPNDYSPDFVHAALSSASGATTNMDIRYTGFTPDRMYCRSLAPGKVVYLDPLETLRMGGNFIDLSGGLQLRNPRRLPAGKYTVTMECVNTNSSAEGPAPGAYMVPVSPWVGDLKAPPIELEIP